MRLQLYWKDSRLKWKSHVPIGNKYLSISLKKMQEMWFPDIFIGKIFIQCQYVVVALRSLLFRTLIKI